jgi:hypothetical protein
VIPNYNRSYLIRKLSSLVVVFREEHAAEKRRKARTNIYKACTEIWSA